MRATENEVHNNAGLAYNLSDLLRDFSTTVQRQFQDLFDTIEDAYRSGLLDIENYEQLMQREKFNFAYADLIDHSCKDLSIKMTNYLEDLAKKMEEYNNIKI